MKTKRDRAFDARTLRVWDNLPKEIRITCLKRENLHCFAFKICVKLWIVNQSAICLSVAMYCNTDKYLQFKVLTKAHMLMPQSPTTRF